MNIGNYTLENGELTFKNVLDRFMECDHVYETIPIFQQEVCTQGFKWVDLIRSYLILSVFAYFISASMERFANYAQKKIDEKKVKIFLLFY